MFSQQRGEALGAPLSELERALDLRPLCSARTMSWEGRSPSSRFTASMMIDLPAPVSPVSTLKPGPNVRSSRSMMARSRIGSSETWHFRFECRFRFQSSGVARPEQWLSTFNFHLFRPKHHTLQAAHLRDEKNTTKSAKSSAWTLALKMVNGESGVPETA